MADPSQESDFGDQYLRAKGFIVSVSGGVQGTDSASNWFSITGGADVVEVCESTVGNLMHKVYNPGASTVSPLVMQGYLTKARNDMSTWINNTVSGQGDPRRLITVTPQYVDGSPAKLHNYHDCLIEEYVFPELHAHTHDPLSEKVTVRPEWHEIQ